jgi:hypothetical protein
LYRERKILLKTISWLKHAKNFQKARTLLPRLLPSTRVLVHPTGENY